MSTYIPSFAPAHRLSRGRRRARPKFWLWRFLDYLGAWLTDIWRAIVKGDMIAWIAIIYVLCIFFLLLVVLVGPHIYERLMQ